MTKQQENTIKALSDKEHLIMRMGLTFGAETGDEDNPFSSQKTVSSREGIENSVDAIEKNGIKNGRVFVHFHKDGGITIKDNGGGIPVGRNQLPNGTPASSLYVAMAVIKSGSNFEKSKDRYSRGTNGVGFASTLSLTSFATVTSHRDKKSHKLTFVDGTPVEKQGKDQWIPLTDPMKLEITKDNRSADEKKIYPSGTEIYFRLDDNNFKSEYPIDYDDLIERMRGMAFLIPNITFEIINEHRIFEDGTYQTELFHFTDGIHDMLALETVEPILEAPISISGKGSFEERGFEKNFEYDLTFTYENDFDIKIHSFVNTIKTRLGGVHHTAFEKSWTTAVIDRLRSMRGGLTVKDKDPSEQDVLEGIVAILSIRVSDPEFTNQIKEELGGRTFQRALQKSLEEQLLKVVNKETETMKILGERIISAAKARQKILEEKLAKRKSNKVASSSLPPELSDCEITHEEESELFICEGLSAAGTIKKSRDATFQAVIPIRGKMLNCWKADTKKILNNKEITDIATAIGGGLGKSFDIDKIRYGKIFIATDADADGLEISNLILTTFYQLFKPIVEEGRLYKALSPLFEIIPLTGKDKTPIYAFTDAEKVSITRNLDLENIKYKIERAKGLGELDAETFFETAMNPETRKLIRIVPEDIKKAEEALNLTMGANSQERRDFMDDNYQVAISSGMIDV